MPTSTSACFMKFLGNHVSSARSGIGQSASLECDLGVQWLTKTNVLG